MYYGCVPSVNQVIMPTFFFVHFQEADMTLNFDEQILEAAKSIAAATAALVKSASAAQRELVAQGKVSCITLYLIFLQAEQQL